MGAVSCTQVESASCSHFGAASCSQICLRSERLGKSSSPPSSIDQAIAVPVYVDSDTVLVDSKRRPERLLMNPKSTNVSPTGADDDSCSVQSTRASVTSSTAQRLDSLDGNFTTASSSSNASVASADSNAASPTGVPLSAVPAGNMAFRPRPAPIVTESLTPKATSVVLPRTRMQAAKAAKPVATKYGHADKKWSWQKDIQARKQAAKV